MIDFIGFQVKIAALGAEVDLCTLWETRPRPSTERVTSGTNPKSQIAQLSDRLCATT